MGTNFGLNDDLEYRELSFDSYDTTIGLSGNYSSINWPLFQIPRPLNNIAAVKILEVQIPFTWYTINSYNNLFQMTDTASAFVRLPVGNFDSLTLANALGITLTNGSPGGFTYTATYSAISQKFTITSSSSTPFTLTMTGHDNIEGNFDPSIVLGMNNINTSTSVGGFASLTSPNAALITGPNYLYVSSQKFGQATNMFLPGEPENHVNAEGLGPQMAKVPINCNPGGIIFWKDPNPLMWFDVQSQTNLSQIDFYLTLGNTNWGWPATTVPLDLNGCSFSIKLGVLLKQMEKTENYVAGVSGGVSSMSGPRGLLNRKRLR
jgi:hypothetical protein